MTEVVAPLVFPVAIVRDTREQRGWHFAGMVADASDHHRPIIVPLVGKALSAGDYSLEGHESQIAIERKSLADLYQTLSRGRKRFTRELERLNALQFAAVVIEAEWSEILLAPPERSRMNQRSIIRSVIAWQQRYPRVHWWAMPDRDAAERLTFQVLRRWWMDHQNG